MKAIELRLGNYVKVKDGICPPLKTNFVTVDCIEDTLRIGIKETPPMWGYFSEDEIEPIPLTEEWLLKFGFFEFNKDYTKEYNCSPDFKTYFDISKWGDGWGIRDYDIVIKYVHQLQNLYFALTGTEL